MRHIRQRNAFDCGLAVVAMLAGRSYHEARQADPFPTKRIGLSIADFLTCISRCTHTKPVDWRVIKPPEYIALSKSKLPSQCAIVIRQKQRKYGHWIACDGEVVHDPELPRAVAIQEYDRKHWDVIRIVVRRVT